MVFYYVENPSIQPVTGFVAAAVRSDFQDAGFTLVTDRSTADFSLFIVINRMESSRRTNEDRLLWGNVLFGAGGIAGGTGIALGVRISCPTLITLSSVVLAASPFGMLLWADDIAARYSMTVIIVDSSTNRIIMQKDYETDEQFSVTLFTSREYSPRYTLAIAIQKSIRQLVQDVARVTR